MRKTTAIAVVAALLLCLVVAAVTQAQGRWPLLGTSRFGTNQMNHGMITVTRNQTLSDIRLQAARAPARITRLMISYRNGTVQDIPLNLRLRQDQMSRPIRLRGGQRGRSIDRVEVWGMSLSPRNIPSRIMVFGR